MSSMMSSVIASYGWWILALLLIAAELIAPGYFLLWIGIAAGVMGLLTLALPSFPFLVQAVIFGVLAVAICLIYWKYIRPSTELRDDQPLLNRKGERMIGRRVLAADAFVNGRGKVKVGDTMWLAEGFDAQAGELVEVIGVYGTTLQVTRLPD